MSHTRGFVGGGYWIGGGWKVHGSWGYRRRDTMFPLNIKRWKRKFHQWFVNGSTRAQVSAEWAQDEKLEMHCYSDIDLHSKNISLLKLLLLRCESQRGMGLKKNFQLVHGFFSGKIELLEKRERMEGKFHQHKQTKAFRFLPAKCFNFLSFLRTLHSSSCGFSWKGVIRKFLIARKKRDFFIRGSLNNLKVFWTIFTNVGRNYYLIEL